MAQRVVRYAELGGGVASRGRTRGGRSCPRRRRSRRPSRRWRPVPCAARTTRRSKRRRAGERSHIARPRPTSSSESAQRRSLGRPRVADAADERARAEVVRPAGVDALLGAGGDEPDVAARFEAREPRRERGERADAGRVVLGAGRGRHGVDVRHQDVEAAARAGERADHVARAADAGDGEAVAGDGEAGSVERLRHRLVRALLCRARRGAAAGERELARERVAGVVGAHEREGGCRGREHGASVRQRGSFASTRSRESRRSALTAYAPSTP